MTLTQAVHRHEHEIQALRDEIKLLREHIELLGRELAYLRPIQPLQPPPFQQPIWPPVTCSATSTDGSN